MRRVSAAFLVVVGILCGVLLVALFGAGHTPVGVSGPTPPVSDPVPIQGSPP